ncbi:MAG: M1 family metallopeptidase [Actinomycetota bacterium]
MASPATQLDAYRLPHHVVPQRYDVRLRPDLTAASFDGSVAIDITLSEATDTVVLNAAELQVRTVRLDGNDAPFELDEPSERLIIRLDEPVPAGSAQLTIEFEGVLNDKLRGFYRSTYTDDDGVEQTIATTQMQATDCRRAFPCWDEPEFKAVFAITLDVEDGLTAVSNGAEVERSIEEPGRTVIRFDDTMVMSTYLVAFVVGRLEVTDPVDVDGIPLRVVHVPGKGHLTDFGLDVGAFCLRWFQEYYGIPYPSDKVDLIGLPDFAAGAMENLGCITFRESLLLVDPATSTQYEQQLVADVVAHELAHMWFGDLVTMRWWNGIWLNEAFATFMEIAACDAYRPDWERWTHFGLERTVAFDTDSLSSTRSVEFEVRSPEEAEAMFDVLTYQKGGALLRMLEQYLGAERFREGVSHYLTTHSYANTETADLWDAIEATSGEPVRRIMDSWIWQPGYPLVSASLGTSDDGPVVELRQQRFAFDAGDDPGADGIDAVWAVPVTLSIGGVPTTVLLDTPGPVAVPMVDADATVVVNAGGHGFFRVSYDDELRGRLVGGSLGDLSTLERYGLVDDAWAATAAGRLDVVSMLRFVEGFADERDLAVWQMMATALRSIGRLVDEDALGAFRDRVRALAGPALESLGEPVDSESDLTAKLRGLLTSLLGGLGRDEATIARCRELFAAASEDASAVDPELTAAATSVVAATGDADDHERMRLGFERGATPQEQLRHLYALAEFDDPELIARTCAYAMSDAVKTQNAPFVLRMAMGHPHHGEQVWAFIRSQWAEANERFPSSSIVRMIDTVKFLDTDEMVADVAAFFAEHPIEQALPTQRQILERQGVNAALRRRGAGALNEHLRHTHSDS